MTAAEKSHIAKVASLPCLICGATPVSIHHVRRYGETRKHSKVVPLCYTHHQGTAGIHTLGKREFERLFMTQDELLRKTDERLGLLQSGRDAANKSTLKYGKKEI